MKYKCGKTFWESDNIGFSKNGLWNIPTEVLVDMGAVPVDSELDEKHSTGDSTCGKCGERELCNCYCHGRIYPEDEKDNHYGDPACPDCKKNHAPFITQPKDEKIETLQEIDVTNWGEVGSHTRDLYIVCKVNELVNAFNKLNGDN